MSQALQPPLRPAQFARLLLHGLDVSAAASRRRKRDQKPDELGLRLKRSLLERLLAHDPEPETFGDWLLDEVLDTQASGARRAVGAELLDEYRLAAADPQYARWLGQSPPDPDDPSQQDATRRQP